METSSLYSYRSQHSVRSNISDITMNNSVMMRQNNNSSSSSSSFNYNPHTIQEDREYYQKGGNQEEEIDEELYEELNEDNPDFVMFKEEVNQWIALDDDIKVLQKALNERKKAKNMITPNILEFMGKYEIEDMNTNNGKLIFAKSTTTKPMNKEYMKNKLGEFLKNYEKGDKATNFLFNNREKTEKFYLKRGK
jgi:hypothetical protein